jgi:hypothetical protein
MKAESMYKANLDVLRNFTREENDALTRVGPATLMGNLFRQYWLPVVPIEHLAQPGGKPLRLNLLGEDYSDARNKSMQSDSSIVESAAGFIASAVL